MTPFAGELAALQAKHEQLRRAARAVVANEIGNQLDPDGREGEQAAVERAIAYGWGPLAALARLVR